MHTCNEEKSEDTREPSNQKKESTNVFALNAGVKKVSQKVKVSDDTIQEKAVGTKMRERERKTSERTIEALGKQ